MAHDLWTDAAWRLLRNRAGLAMPSTLARSAGVRTLRFALVDLRSVEAQRAVPYVLGEIVWLDDEDGSSNSR